DHEGLAELVGQPFREQAGDDVSRAARRRRDQDANGARRIGVRPRPARKRGPRRGDAGEAKKLTAMNAHDASSPRKSETDPVASQLSALTRPMGTGHGRRDARSNCQGCSIGISTSAYGTKGRIDTAR